MRVVRNFTFRQQDPNSVLLIDVTDLAWSPEDRYLASVGLDSQVLIWSGYTLGGLFGIIVRSLFQYYMAILHVLRTNT
jgi:WD40 repeat protein